ncbi:MAG: hypothetical protein EOQ89_03595 [Mesorhizobium sp.]|nr:MAG: hypothetical protein EOQ89_03595 [Mesorhizobium sp.]
MTHTVNLSDTQAVSLGEWLHLVDLALPSPMRVGDHLRQALHHAAQGRTAQEAAERIIERSRLR